MAAVMINREEPSIYDITMTNGEKLGVKPEFLVSLYSKIDSIARQMAPQEIRNELVISEDVRVKTTFRVRVSSRMAPYLINAIQQQADPCYGIALRSYLYSLQEQLMAQVFAKAGQMTFPKFS